MFGGLGIWELLFIFMIVLLFFGAKRLPEIGSSLGKGIREFKDSISGLDEETSREIPAGERREEHPDDRRSDPAPRESAPGERRSERGEGGERRESGGSGL